MKRLIVIVLLSGLALEVSAQRDSLRLDVARRDSSGRFAWQIELGEVSVVGQRPLKKIGVQETKITDEILRDNIASQMSDALKYGTSIYVKEYGRATLATVSFRGTSPSHTQVMWNGVKINSPMLGMVDFSMIPSYFIDDASLLHGTSSVNTTGGGLGGAVVLSTRPADVEGFNLQYVQGVGSFNTFDEFLRLTYGDRHWQVSTRAVYSSSDNDFKYRNYNKKLNVYDDDHNIIDSYYPVERNKSCDFNDFHFLQEVYYNTGGGNRFGLSAWYLDSRRGVPMLSVDQKDASEFINEQNEHTFRGALSWDRIAGNLKTSVKGGYIHTNLGYDYSRDLGNGELANMIHSRSYVNTFNGTADVEYSIGRKWLFIANVAAYQHLVKSEDRNIITQQGNNAIVGYDKGRVELSGYLSVKWRPAERVGISLAVREEMYGRDWTPVIPAFFFDYVVSKKGNVIAKASISRNYRFPTLNDLYFLPGGNPDLKKEQGFTYDAGAEFTIGQEKKFRLHGEITWFDSYIDDWIVWLPSFKGFWTPVNVKKVHAYGVELKGNLAVQLSKSCQFGLDGNFSWTPSINHGDPVNWADEAIGKQLVYVPEYSAAVNGRLSWKTWNLMYKWCHYSERFTTSSNETATKIGRVLPYYMSDITIEKQLSFRWAAISVKGVVKNIFNEEYESVLSHPMPGTNFEVFLGIIPKWGKRRNIN